MIKCRLGSTGPDCIDNKRYITPANCANTTISLQYGVTNRGRVPEFLTAVVGQHETNLIQLATVIQTGETFKVNQKINFDACGGAQFNFPVTANAQLAPQGVVVPAASMCHAATIFKLTIPPTQSTSPPTSRPTASYVDGPTVTSRPARPTTMPTKGPAATPPTAALPTEKPTLSPNHQMTASPTTPIVTSNCNVTVS